MEFVFGIVILSLIAIALAKTTLTLQKQALTKSTQSILLMDISNAADIIKNHLQAESSFYFLDSTLSAGAHSVFLHDSVLFLDGALLARNISSFEVHSISGKAFSINICARNATGAQTSCINRVGWLK